MAVIAEVYVAAATREQHDDADAKVAAAIERLGGPPAGLMFHLASPSGDGFVLMDIWRDEIEARRFFDTIVTPAMTETGLAPEELRIRPVWGMAKP